MRRFVFGLEKVLDYRQAVEKVAKAYLGEAEQHLAREQEALAVWCQRLEKEVEVSPAGVIDVSHWQHRDQYLDYVDMKVELQKQVVGQAENQVEAQRQQVIAAMQEREVVSKLRDRKRSQYIQEALRQDQKVLDEAASNRFLQQKRAKKMGQGM